LLAIAMIGMERQPAEVVSRSSGEPRAGKGPGDINSTAIMISRPNCSKRARQNEPTDCSEERIGA